MNLVKIIAKAKKRPGRGYGSGRGGHTTGRGQKGQKTRGKISPLFEGTKVKKSLLQRLPMRRGKGKFNTRSDKPVPLSLSQINQLPSGTKIDLQTLFKNGIIEKEAVRFGVKLLGNGKLEKKMIVNIPTTAGAKRKIEKAGGKVQE